MLSGRARLALCAAGASIMTACSLLPLVTPTNWLFQALLLVLVQTGVGALARRVPLPRPLTVLAQALVSLLLLTLMFARTQAALGVLPGPRVFVRFGELLTGGVQDVGQFAIPAPVTPGIRLLLVGGVVLIALAVDALAVTYGSAAPAGLPLLALYAIAAGLSGTGGRWLWFLIAATGYLLLLLAEGRDRLSRWGRVFGGSGTGPAASGPAWQTESSAVAPVRTGRRIGAMALGIALIAPAALPSLNGGLLAVAGAGRGAGRGGGTISAVNPVVALQNQLNQPDSREVFRYRTNSTDVSDMYLRFVALDQFNGSEWTPSKRALSDVPKVMPTPQGLGSDVRTEQVVTSVAADKDYAQLWLPLPYPAMKVDIGGRWRYEPVGRTLIGDRGQTTQGVNYTVTSLKVNPTAAQLERAPAPDADIQSEFTKLPDSLPAVVGRTAADVTKDATTEYDKAVALQRWFTSGQFTYSTSVRSGTGVQAITRFLKDKEGFCVHFAFTMAAMARTLKIPARVAVGFTPGTPLSDGSYSVGLRDAHAWPELYFQGIGWTRFEPTPTRGTPPGYTLQDTPSTGSSAQNTPSNGASAAPQPSSSSSTACTAKERNLGDCGAPLQTPSSGSSGGGFAGWKVALIVLLAVLGLTLPVLPMLLRRRARNQRLDGGHLGGGQGAAGWVQVWGLTGDASDGAPPSATGGLGDGGLGDRRALAAWREMLDTAWDYGMLPDESETPRRAAARLIQEGRLDEEAAQAVWRVATAVEQALYSPRPQPANGLAADVRLIRDGLHATADRMARLRATLLPRSSVRLVWRLTEQWSAFTARTTATLNRWTAFLLRRPSDASQP
jgi:transglutaminase-like putative cysteine protease